MVSWSRRGVLQAGAAAALAASSPAPAGSGDTLHVLARKKGLRFGTALGARGFWDPLYLDLVAAQCGIVVPENELKMTVVQRQPGEFRFEPAEKILGFAESHDLRTRGHTLLWHHPKWLPPWLASHDFGPAPATSAAELLSHHVRKVTSYFGKRICSWDAVNEAVHNVTGEMRDTVFSRAIGTPDQVIEIAFRTAREQLPDTELVYNDYMGWEKDGGPHRDGVLRLLERLRRIGAPVNALGIQAHLGGGNQQNNADRPFDSRDELAWRKFLGEVTGMGYRLLITELDVNDGPLAGDRKSRDKAVAALARDFLDITLDFREVNALVCWGLSDNFSWLHGRGKRDDGEPKRPTPYDTYFKPKPLREAIAAALRAAPERRPVMPRGEPA